MVAGARSVGAARHRGTVAWARLFLARNEPWSEADQYLAQELADGYGHAWNALLRGRSRNVSAMLWRRRTGLKVAAALAIFAAMWLPITLSALAPAEVTPFQPTIVRAPLEGVVDHFEVQPNEQVEAGQLLLTLDPRAIENKLEVASKALAVAEAEYRQAAQQAVFDDKSRALLAVLKGRAEQRRADVTYNRSRCSIGSRSPRRAAASRCSTIPTPGSASRSRSASGCSRSPIRPRPRSRSGCRWRTPSRSNPAPTSISS